MAEEVGMAIAPMIVEPLMKRVIRHVLYAFNYNKILEQLKRETAELKATQDRVKHDVEKAKCNAEEIEVDVATWQVNVEKIAEEVMRLEEDVAEKKSFNGLGPNLLGRYRLGKLATKKKDIITKLREKGNFPRVSYFPSSNLPGIEFYETKDFMPSESARSALKRIMKELEDDKKKMIALYGMGGVGKTTLAVEVGKKAKEVKLVDQVVMVVVSQCPSIEGIQGQIADMIGLHFEESSNIGKANRLRLRLEESKERILIVLDDLWSKLDMAAIGIPSADNCKVLLTTRQRQVCGTMGSVCGIPIDVLTDEEAWALFSRSGGLTGNEPYPLVHVAKLVAKECKGLPLAILAVAKALKGKADDQWKVALQQLKGSRYLRTVDADRDVYKCIRFSYDYLQNEEAKECFMLCSLFPEDHNIEVEQLVRYAYGLGLFRDAVDSIEDVRTEVHAVITSLKASSLLLSGSDDNWGQEAKEFVKMHDIVRDVALLISADEGNSVSRLKAGMGLEEWPMGISKYQSVRKISLLKNKIAKHRSGLVCPKLNLLLLDDNGCYKFPNDFFYGMKELQVLSVSYHHRYWNIPSFSLPRSVQRLQNLHTLRMECLRLDDISVVGKLKRLEILSLSGSQLEELPDNIGELNELRLLDLSGCTIKIGMPANLLKKLSRLEDVHIRILKTDEESCNVILSELMSLSKLCVLSLEIDNVVCLGSNICFPKHLSRYYISLGEVGRLSTPKSKALVLKKIGVAKLNAMKEIIPGVDSLELAGMEDDCISNIMPAIIQSGLDQLTSLDVSSCRSMECLLDTTDIDCIPTTAVSKLDSLHLRHMNSFKEFIRGSPPSGFFQDLGELHVKNCNKLCTIVPAKLSRRLPNLKEVIVERCLEAKDLFELDVKSNERLLSNMETLSVEDIPELTRIWKGPTIGAVSLARLRELRVYRCPKLTSLLSVSHAPSLVQLQSLRVWCCKELKYVFSADEGVPEIQSIVHEPTVLFPQLKVLQLEELPNLTGFKHESHILPLPLMPSLEELCVGGCPKMGTQFIADLRIFEKKLQVLNVEGISFPKLSIKDVQGLQPVIPIWVNGRELRISNCNGLEELLQVGLGGVVNVEHDNAPSVQLQVSWLELRLENVADLACIWRGPSQIFIFHNLQELRVSECHGLKNHLLTTSVSRSLLQLSSLSVDNCKELEHIFADDETGLHDKRTTLVQLPKLATLDLFQLPNLISFCPPAYHFKFPLKTLSVIRCPNNNTGFFRETSMVKRFRSIVVKTTKVHAKGEALCSSQNRGICNDIFNEGCLPLYEEEIDAEGN